MKRIIALFLVFFLGCLTGCGEKPQEKTASENQLRQVGTQELSENTIIHEGLTEILPDLKNLVRKSLADKDYLNWEQFENVSQVREFKNPELAKDFETTTAFYPVGSPAIIVCPKFFSEPEVGIQKTYVLAHELIHSLIGAGEEGNEENMNLFIEGIADYLAESILREAQLEGQYLLTYQNELCCLSWLTSLYGADEVTKTICDGEIINFIDEKVGQSGIGVKLHECLATIDYSQDREAVKDAILAEIDILSKISGSDEEVRDYFIESFKSAYAPYLN